MNPLIKSAPMDSLMMTRREAIRRTALALGVAISPSLLTGVLQAQPVAPNATAAPVYLSAKQFETAGAIAERILPKTDTPGARDVGVPAFIDLMYGKYMTPEEKVAFALGLAEVEAASAAFGQRSFQQLSPAQQDDLLKKIANAAQEKEKIWKLSPATQEQKTFFSLIKELTLLGFFTSEPIGKNVLHYDPVPGRYDGCIPLSDVGNVSWTR
jgi:gluconate 2-dehydrogenase gamma chain